MLLNFILPKVCAYVFYFRSLPTRPKLALAYREAMRAEAMGQPLKYLSEDEVEAALGFRKQITKAVTHKVVGKN